MMSESQSITQAKVAERALKPHSFLLTFESINTLLYLRNNQCKTIWKCERLLEAYTMSES